MLPATPVYVSLYLLCILQASTSPAPLPWLLGFQVKFLYLVLFSLYLSLLWELRDKRNLKILQF